MNFRMVLVVCFVVVISGWSAEASELDSLVAHIETRYASYADYDTFSASVVSITRQMDAKWRPKEEVYIEKKLTVKGKKTEEEILKAIKTKKGKVEDITEKVLEAQRKAGEKKKKGKQDEDGNEFSIGMDELLPFNSEKRSLYEFTLLEDSVVFDCPVYTIQSAVKGDVENGFEGRYYFDKETYDLLLVDVRPLKNPKFVKTFDIKMWFDVKGNQYLIMTKNWMRIVAGFLFKKIRMEIDETYTHYQIVPNVSVSGEELE